MKKICVVSGVESKRTFNEQSELFQFLCPQFIWGSPFLALNEK
jgi:hypothetical protein